MIDRPHDSAPEAPEIDKKLELEKATLRAAARVCRQSAAGSVADAGRRVAKNLFDSVAFEAGTPVSGYWPIKSELDIKPSLQRLAEDGHPIGLPIIVAKGEPLIFRRWRPGDRLADAGFGTREPVQNQPRVTPRLLLVPLLSFDRAGYRLGYGGGFYDRTISGLRAKQTTLAVGVAFSAQEVPKVPRDRFDQRLDWIVTESEAFQIQ